MVVAWGVDVGGKCAARAKLEAPKEVAGVLEAPKAGGQLPIVGGVQLPKGAPPNPRPDVEKGVP